jgi:hypothetical protein
MKWGWVFSLLGAMALVASVPSCFSSTKWNADQAAEIRRRAAFDLSCAPEDLEIVELQRDGHGLVQELRAVGCDKQVTFVNAKGGFASSQWILTSDHAQANRHIGTETARR